MGLESVIKEARWKRSSEEEDLFRVARYLDKDMEPLKNGIPEKIESIIKKVYQIYSVNENTIETADLEVKNFLTYIRSILTKHFDAFPKYAKKIKCEINKFVIELLDLIYNTLEKEENSLMEKEKENEYGIGFLGRIYNDSVNSLISKYTKEENE